MLLSAEDAINYTTMLAASYRGRQALSGDHIEKATPVPIPNTVVKLFKPMVVL